MEPLSSSRKCPTCGQWSEWNQNPSDRCRHCGNVLDPQAVKARKKRQEDEFRQKDQLNITLIEIYPYDSAFTRFWKRIVQAFQISLMAIISFIIWLIALLAG